MGYHYETAKCGCEVEIDVSTYMDGCCDLCYSEVTEVESVEIAKPCALHGGT